MFAGSRCVLLGLVCLMTGCSTTKWRSNVHLPPVARVDSTMPFVKCHTAYGHVIVLTDWRIDRARGTISGRGIHYDENRRVVHRGSLTVPYRRVVLLEASQLESSFNGWKTATVGCLVSLALLVAILFVG